jgi:hypothetical protein
MMNKALSIQSFNLIVGANLQKPNVVLLIQINLS